MEGIMFRPLQDLTPMPGPSKASTALGFNIDNDHYLAGLQAVSTNFVYFY